MKKKYLIVAAILLISTPFIIPQVQSVYAYYAGLYTGLVERLEKLENEKELVRRLETLEQVAERLKKVSQHLKQSAENLETRTGLLEGKAEEAEIKTEMLQQDLKLLNRGAVSSKRKLKCLNSKVKHLGRNLMTVSNRLEKSWKPKNKGGKHANRPDNTTVSNIWSDTPIGSFWIHSGN